MRITLLSLALVTTLGVNASFNSSPLLAWSTSVSPVLDSIASLGHLAFKAEDVLKDVLYTKSACDYDAVIIVSLSDLTASDIRSLPQSSSLVRRMRAAPSSLYVPQSYSERQSSSISQRLAAICNTQVVEIDLSASSSQFEAPLARNPVFEITIPSVGRKVDDRDYQLFQKETQLSNLLDVLLAAYPQHLTVIASSESPKHASNRVSRDLQDMQLPAIFYRGTSSSASAVSKPDTKPRGSLLSKYQFLTPGLITILIITFGLLAPLLYFVIYALATIKSPLRADSFKPTTLEKKTQ